MNKIKFCITYLSAVLMIPAQVAWASFDTAHKAKFNNYIKENFKGTFGDFYRNHAYMFDEESRGLMESWLRHYGNKDLPQPQAMIIRDKSGKDTLKLLFNDSGRNLTLTFAEGDYEHFDINGKKFSFGEVRNAQGVLAKLAENDISLTPMVRASKTAVIPVSRKQELLSVGQFAKLSRLQKVEYLQLLRQNVEAAQGVFDAALTESGQAQLQLPPNSPLYVFHPLFASKIAWAASAGVKENDKCIVAGNVSVYEREGGRLACSAFPVKNPKGFQPQPAFHDRCTEKGKGRMVACNPLLYGTSESGEPFCVDSGNQPHFTLKATADCNGKSPLHSNPNSKERRGDYERILKSYYLLKGNSADKLKDCFNEEHKINETCRNYFEGQYNDFVQFKNDAEKICKTVKLKDQFKACDELRKRALDLITFLGSASVPPVLPYPEVNLIKEGCLKVPGATWDEEIRDCICPNHKRAVDVGGNQFECPVNTNPPTPPVAVEKKDDCKKDDGSEKNSFKCNPTPWLLGIAALGVLAWLMTGKDKDKDKPTNPPTPGPGPVLIPPVVTVVPGTTSTTQAPPTPTTPPNNEGNNGVNPSSGAGGVRSAK